jgi:putative ubiquitin-RnfH superfamily antitoxin RatB of RatAB toxin-antitoxin module
MGDEPEIRVEVVYALPDRQRLVELEVPRGCTVREAVERSGLQHEFPEIGPEDNALGIFGRRCAPDQRLRDGDRVEIYRPLKADPKEVRRQLAARGRTMGRDGESG